MKLSDGFGFPDMDPKLAALAKGLTPIQMIWIAGLLAMTAQLLRERAGKPTNGEGCSGCGECGRRPDEA